MSNVFKNCLAIAAAAALAVTGTAAFAAGEGEESEGSSGSAAGVMPTRFNEAPMLAEMVASGELPPVDERMPAEPMVRPVFDEIGTYGGTLFVYHRDPSPWQDVGDMTEISPRFFRQNLDGSFDGGLIVDYEQSPDYTNLILHVRPGMRWSDGDPLDAEDFVFAFKDMHLKDGVEMWNFMGAPLKDSQQISEYSFSITWTEPVPNIVTDFAGPAGGAWVGLQPAHYLKKWHIDYGDDAEALAKEEGFDTWEDAFRSHYWWNPSEDLARPTIHPWVLTSSDTVRKVMDRNPYYMVVDSAGNQLPYIDQVVGEIVDAETYDLKIVSGEADIAYLFTTFENFSLYKQSEESGDYTVYLVPGLFGSEMGLQPNWNVGDPVKRELIQNRDFRIALSVAINRDEINEVIYFGQGTPRQATVPESFSVYDDAWAQAHAQYDPELANELLDGIGLTERDRDGFRVAPDGSPLQFTIHHQVIEIGSSRGELLELIKEYWEDVGIRIELRGHEPSFFWELTDTDQFDIAVRAFEKLIQHLAASTESNWAPLWDQWLSEVYAREAGGGSEGDLPGEQPPEWIEEHDRRIYKAQQTPEQSDEYRDLIYQIAEAQAENLFWIGTVGQVPVPVVAQNRVGNVMTSFVPRHVWTGGLSEFADQLYLKDQ